MILIPIYRSYTDVNHNSRWIIYQSICDMYVYIYIHAWKLLGLTSKCVCLQMEDAPKWQCERAHDDRPWDLFGILFFDKPTWKFHQPTYWHWGRQIIIKLNMGRIRANPATILLYWQYEQDCAKYGGGVVCCQSCTGMRKITPPLVGCFRTGQPQVVTSIFRDGKCAGKSSANGRLMRAAMFLVSEIVYYYWIIYSDKESRTCPSEVWNT